MELRCRSLLSEPFPLSSSFHLQEEYRMTDKTAPKAQTTPSMVKKIGKTTYIMTAHFNENSRETVDDKIKRMLKDEVKNEDFSA